MARERRALDVENLVERYLDGESEQALARSLGVERGTIRRRLVRAGIPPRGRSEALLIRMARTDPKDRRLLTAAANAAARGRTPSADELARRAIRKQQTLSKVGIGEMLFADWLRAQGLFPAHQFPVGPYNLDLAVTPTVAVEIHVKPGHPLTGPGLRKRTNYLLDRGWNVVYVAVSGRWFLSEAAADYVVAFVEEVQRNPSPWGLYRVIRGTGELVTAGEGQLDERPVVPAPVADLDA